MADNQNPSLRSVITQIADQLCDTIDNNFDIHVAVDTPDTEGQKLALLVNFLLENVRRSLDDMQSLNMQLEDKVKERTSLLDLILAGSNDGVWIWDIANDELTLSGRWYSMLELPHDANTQSPEFWLQQIHPADRDRFRDAIKRLRKGESEHLNVEYRVKTAHQGYRWMLCRGVCQKDNNQQCSIVAGTQTDISAMRIFDQESGMPNERYLRERVEDAITEEQSLFLVYVTVENIDAILTSSEHPSNAMLYPIIQERLSKVSNLHLAASKLSAITFAVMGFESELTANNLTIEDVCQQLRDNCANTQHTFDDEIRFEVAVGAVVSSMLHIEQSQQLINYAWSALRRARQLGQTCIFTAAHISQDSRRMRVEQELRRSLMKNTLAPDYQAIYHGKTKTLEGFEALARFRHAELGTVSPGEFIPIAEDAGLMRELGYSILDSTIATIQRWQTGALRHHPFYIAVNVSAIQLQDPYFADNVLAKLEGANVSPKRLKLEVTESTLVESFKHAAEQIDKLRQQGVRIALDDFGTGYSSLSYLRSLAIDTLKIDRSFVANLHENKQKSAIIKTVYELATELDLSVVAEGVEEAEELDFLNSIGDMAIQGFLLARPLPADEVIEQLPRGTY